MKLTNRAGGIAVIPVVASAVLAGSAGTATAEENAARPQAGHRQSLPPTADTERGPKNTFAVTLKDNGGASGYHVVCQGTKKGHVVRRPHYSKGAGGAIYKTVIKCTGHGLSGVDLRVRGLLSFAKSKDPDNTHVHWEKRARSSQWQHVMVNGKAKTYYTPEEGKNGGRGTGFWRNTSTWYFVHHGKTSTVGSETHTT